METRKDIYTAAALETIESTEWDFIGAKTQQHLHSLHSYPARMIPQIPRKAILDYTKEGDLVLDPFAGCGTTLLEAILLGRDVIGVDSNPVACLISNAKIASYTPEDFAILKNFLEQLDHMLLDKNCKPSIPVYKNMEYWFAKDAIEELGKIKSCIYTLPNPCRILALCCLSTIIVRVSYQTSDTKYARKESEYLPGTSVKNFKAKLTSAIAHAEEISTAKRGDAKVLSLDGRRLEGIKDNSVKLIVTSPPYLNAYDYHKYHRHRMQWIDGDVAFARDREIGKHDTFTRKGATPEPYFADMELCFREWYRVLQKGGLCLVVIGDAIVSGQPVAVADTFITQMQKIGMHCERRWIRHLDINKKSFNQQSRIKKEHVILFRKN